MDLKVLSLLLLCHNVDASSSRLAYRRGQGLEVSRVHTLTEQQQELDEQNFFSVLNEEDRFLFSFSYSMSYPSSSSWDSSSQSADTPNLPSISNVDPVIPVSSLSPTPVTSTDTPTFTKSDVRATLSPTSKPFIQTSSSSFSSSSPTSTPTFTKVVVRKNDPLPSTSVRTCTNQALENDISSSRSPSETQTIELVFKYSAEVTSSDNDDEFLTAVESKLLDTVSSAVLKCDSTRRGRMLFHPIIRRNLQVTQVSSMPPDQIVGKPTPRSILCILWSFMSIRTIHISYLSNSVVVIHHRLMQSRCRR